MEAQNRGGGGGARMRLRAVLVCVVALAATTARAQLQVGYYDTLCPAAEIIVQEEVSKGVSGSPGTAAGLLRLHFHDCFVRAGGSQYQVPAGRRDGNVSVAGETSGNLPPPTANVKQLNQIFGSKGLSQKEMVALSGAHTIGMAQCTSFESRLYSYTPSAAQDPSMDPGYLATLTTQCPQGGAGSQLVPMDYITPNAFDTNYYANVVANKSLLTSDQALLADPATSAQVIGYTTSPDTFQTDFAAAMVSMGAIGVLTGSSGTIRTNCRVVG